MTQPEESLQPLSAVEIGLLTANELCTAETVTKLFMVPDAVQRGVLIGIAHRRLKDLKASTRDFDDIVKAYEFEQQKQQFNSNVTAYTNAPEGLSLLCGDWVCNDIDGVRGVSRLSILPVAIYKDATDDNERVKIAYRQPAEDKWRYIVLSRKTVQDSRQIMCLSDKGFDVTNDSAKDLSRYLTDLMAINRDKIPIGRSVPRVGWYGEEFLPYGNKTYFNGDENYRLLFDSICERGDFDKWRNAVIECAEEAIQMRLLLAASFASVLTQITGIQPFVVHLYGGTGLGKTIALMIAASVWGNPAFDGMLNTLNMTVNAMCETMGFLHDIPMIGDELQTIKVDGARNYDDLIMRLCEGKSRARMHYNELIPAKTWNNIAITSGEEPVTRSNSGGGAKNRVIEIELDKPISSDFGTLVDVIKNNYGFAGRIFVEKLNRNEAQSIFKYNFESIKAACTGRSDKQYMPMALMRTAYRLADGAVFGGRLPDLSIDMLEPYMYEAAEVSASERAYSWLCDHIAANRNRFFADDNHGEVWGRMDTTAIWFNKSILERELIGQGYDFNAVKKDWANKRYIEKNSANKYTFFTHTRGERSCYIKIPLTANVGALSADVDGF